MKLYKSPENDVWAYELDGSQDHLISEDFISITQEEADKLNQIKIDALLADIPKPTKEELHQQLLMIQAQLDELK